jgi:hypothetical protein
MDKCFTVLIAKESLVELSSIELSHPFKAEAQTVLFKDPDLTAL